MASRVVLMTGSSSGIGLAVAKRLALDPDQRFIVIATVTSLTRKADLEAAIGSVLNKTIFIRELDILKDEDITRVVDDVINTYGRIDVLINIAGVGLIKVPEDVTRQEMDRLFGVNLIGTIRLTQAVLPNMKQRMGGMIITCSSVLGKIGWPYGEFYVATKYGLEGFFESLAAGVKAFNIKVCLFQPGLVDTPMVTGYAKNMAEYCEGESLRDIDRRQLKKQLENVAKNTLQQADDIAEAVVTRCLDVDEPAFRHLVAQEDIKGAIAMSVPDLTGETAIAIGLQGIN